MLLKKLLKKSCALLVASSIAASSLSFADERKEGWYTTVSGDYSVRESLYGFIYATLGTSKGGDARIYLESYSPDHCRENGERVIEHNPLYINGTLVKFAQHCRGEWNLFFAVTKAGSDHLVNQFKRSRSVEVKTLDGTALIFSAMGFSDHYRRYNVREDAL